VNYFNSLNLDFIFCKPSKEFYLALRHLSGSGQIASETIVGSIVSHFETLNITFKDRSATVEKKTLQDLTPHAETSLRQALTFLIPIVRSCKSEYTKNV
jgi:hypothetical protein